MDRRSKGSHRSGRAELSRSRSRSVEHSAKRSRARSPSERVVNEEPRVRSTVELPSDKPLILVDYASDSRSEGEVSGTDLEEQSGGASAEPKMTYRDKLALLSQLLQFELPRVKVKSSSYTDTEPEFTYRLPTAPKFESYLDGFEAELEAKEGSKRARSSPGVPYDLHKGPGRPQVKMNCYEVAQPAWRRMSSAMNASLTSTTDKSLYRPAYAPYVRLDQKRMQEWENVERDNLAIESHTDWFIRGTLAGLDNLFRELSERAEKDTSLSHLANSAADLKELLESAGMGVQHLALNSVHMTGSMVLARRDSFLDYMKDKISRESLWRLRFSDLQGPYLFEPPRLEEAKRDAERRSADTKHDQLIEALRENKTSGSASGKQDKPTFQRKPFSASQVLNSGGQQSPFLGSNQRGNGRGRGNQQNRGSRGGNRGSRGRGGRGQ